MRACKCASVHSCWLIMPPNNSSISSCLERSTTPCHCICLKWDPSSFCSLVHDSAGPCPSTVDSVALLAVCLPMDGPCRMPLPSKRPKQDAPDSEVSAALPQLPLGTTAHSTKRYRRTGRPANLCRYRVVRVASQCLIPASSSGPSSASGPGHARRHHFFCATPPGHPHPLQLDRQLHTRYLLPVLVSR